MSGNDQAESRRQIVKRTDPFPAGQISDLFKLAPEYLGAHKENEWDCGGRRNAQGCFRGSWNTRSSPSLFPSLSLLFSSSFTFSLSLFSDFPYSFLPSSSRCRARLPLFAYPPMRSLPPFSVLRESKLLSAGWPAVLPWIYIAALRTLNILRSFDLCETFAKYSSLISVVRNRGRARTCARFRVMRGDHGVSSRTR